MEQSKKSIATTLELIKLVIFPSECNNKEGLSFSWGSIKHFAEATV